jgi:exosome complex RNA-binding protein Rrp42 (RNase PH superfamily)
MKFIGGVAPSALCLASWATISQAKQQPSKQQQQQRQNNNNNNKPSKLQISSIDFRVSWCGVDTMMLG